MLFLLKKFATLQKNKSSLGTVRRNPARTFAKGGDSDEQYGGVLIFPSPSITIQESGQFIQK
jgi:hypothetical protein